MSKSNHSFGQPLYGRLTNLSDKEKILELSRRKGGEHYKGLKPLLIKEQGFKPYCVCVTMCLKLMLKY